jgi:hypothetical protein
LKQIKRPLLFPKHLFKQLAHFDAKRFGYFDQIQCRHIALPPFDASNVIPVKVRLKGEFFLRPFLCHPELPDFGPQPPQ